MVNNIVICELKAIETVNPAWGGSNIKSFETYWEKARIPY